MPNFVLIMNQFNNFLVMENPQNFWWKFAKFFASHSFLVFDTDMSNILNPSKTQRGKAGVIDNHNYFYAANQPGGGGGGVFGGMKPSAIVFIGTYI